MTLFQFFGDLENQKLPIVLKIRNLPATGGGKQDWSTFKNFIPREWLWFYLSGDLVKDPAGKAIFIWPMLELTHTTGLLL